MDIFLNSKYTYTINFLLLNFTYDNGGWGGIYREGVGMGMGE